MTHELIILEQSLLEPANRSNREYLDKLIAEDFQEVGASGAVFGKEVVLAQLPTEDDETQFIGRDFTAKMLTPEVGLVTFVVTKLMAGQPPKESYRASLWQKFPQGWQMVYHQGTHLSS